MSALFEIGFQYEEKKEKKLIDSINQALSEIFPNNPEFKLSKVKNKNMLEGYLPFQYSHIYGVLMKKVGIYLDVYPNVDINGRQKFESVSCSWIMFVNCIGFYSSDSFEIFDQDNPKAKEYIEALLSRTVYRNYILHNYKIDIENERK